MVAGPQRVPHRRQQHGAQRRPRAATKPAAATQRSGRAARGRAPAAAGSGSSGCRPCRRRRTSCPGSSRYRRGRTPPARRAPASPRARAGPSSQEQREWRARPGRSTAARRRSGPPRSSRGSRGTTRRISRPARGGSPPRCEAPPRRALDARAQLVGRHPDPAVAEGDLPRPSARSALDGKVP